MEQILLNEILLLLAISAITIFLFRRIHLPPIIAYLLVGIITGPYAFGWISDVLAVKLLGEIGVVFLLFTIGLDFSITQFFAIRKTLLGLGSAQVVAGTLAGGIIAWSFGIPWQGAIIVGGALSLSSTAIVVKQLTEQLELQSVHGRLAFSILLFQDLAAVPFIALIPVLAVGGSLGWPLLITLIKGLAVMTLILLFGKWLLRPLFHAVASTRSDELFTLTVLAVSLIAAWTTHATGLSFAFGAFLAGMMLSETEFRHQIEIEIRPFRDVLLGLFFIIVGMQLKLYLIPEIWPQVLLLVAGVVFGKGFIIFLLLRLLNYPTDTSVRTGQILAQGGEFSIALLVLAVLNGIISDTGNQPIIIAVIISMMIAPLLINFNDVIYKYLFPLKEPETDNEFSTDLLKDELLKDHVIICGFGRVGRTVADSLTEEDINYIGLDSNPEVVKKGLLDYEQVYFGDATNIKILDTVNLKKAKVVVICVDDPGKALKILRSIRRLSDSVLVLLRAPDEENMDIFMDEGADSIIPETLEAGTMLTTHLLLMLKKSPDEVYDHIKRNRSKHYPLLESYLERK